MPKFREIVVATVLPAIKEVGKAEMKQVLSGIKEHNSPETYRNTLQGMHSNFSLLREAASKTKTRIDDGIVDLVLEAVQEIADTEGIVFS
jgi:hypothetical protein